MKIINYYNDSKSNNGNTSNTDNNKSFRNDNSD